MSSIFGDEPAPRKPKPARAGRITEGDDTFRAAPGPGPVPPSRPKKKRPATIDDVAEPVVGGPSFVERLLFGTVSTAHLAKFCRQFAAYQESGVDLVRSLASLEKQFARTALGPVIGRLSLAVRRGHALGDAMAAERQAFDPLFLSMIRVAEARGGVPETLRQMADHYEARLSLMRQARSAMIYPIAVVLVATVVGYLLTVFVLPKLVEVLADFGKGRIAQLPLPTRMLMGISNFMQHVGWWAVPAGLVAGFFALTWAYRRPAGKAAMDEVSLYVPVLGALLRKIDVARMARSLSSLLNAGVDMVESLALTADVVHLTPFRRVLHGAQVAVMEGEELSRTLDASRRFPTDVIAFVESGEETGRLPESLAKLADDYEEQVQHMVRNLSSLIQPLLVIALGGVVFFIVLAFIMAYVSILSGLSAGL